MPADRKTLLKVKSIGCLKKLVLSLDTHHSKNDGINQPFIHIGEITLTGQLQDSVVESVHVFSLPLRDFGELKSGHPEVTNRLTKLFKSLQHIVDIICLVRL